MLKYALLLLSAFIFQEALSQQLELQHKRLNDTLEQNMIFSLLIIMS